MHCLSPSCRAWLKCGNRAPGPSQSPDPEAPAEWTGGKRKGKMDFARLTKCRSHLAWRLLRKILLHFISGQAKESLEQGLSTSANFMRGRLQFPLWKSTFLKVAEVEKHRSRIFSTFHINFNRVEALLYSWWILLTLLRTGSFLSL